MIERISRALGSVELKLGQITSEHADRTVTFLDSLFLTHFGKSLDCSKKPQADTLIIKKHKGSTSINTLSTCLLVSMDNIEIEEWEAVCLRLCAENMRVISVSENLPPADIDISESQCDCCRTKYPGQDLLLLRDKHSGEYLRLVSGCFSRKYKASEFEAIKSEFLAREYAYQMLSAIENQVVFGRIEARMIPKGSIPPIFQNQEAQMHTDKDNPINQFGSKYKVTDAVAYLVAHYRSQAYVSKAKAQSSGLKATATEVYTRMLMDIQEIKYDENLKPTDSDYKSAREIEKNLSTFYTELTEKDEFQLKVEQELLATRVNQTSIAILALPVFKETQGTQDKTKSSGFLGEVGKRLEIPLKYISSKPFYSKNLDKNFFRHNFIDEHNRNASWVTEAPAESFGLYSHKWTIAKFTVKATDTFNETEFTNIHRVSTTGCFDSKPLGENLHESKKEASLVEAALNLFDSKKREKSADLLTKNKDLINNSPELLATIATDLFMKTLRTRRGEAAGEWIVRMLSTGIDLPKTHIAIPARGQFDVPTSLNFSQACKRWEAHDLAKKYQIEEIDPFET